MELPHEPYRLYAGSEPGAGDFELLRQRLIQNNGERAGRWAVQQLLSRLPGAVSSYVSGGSAGSVPGAAAGLGAGAGITAGIGAAVTGLIVSTQNARAMMQQKGGALTDAEMLDAFTPGSWEPTGALYRRFPGLQKLDFAFRGLAQIVNKLFAPRTLLEQQRWRTLIEHGISAPGFDPRQKGLPDEVQAAGWVESHTIGKGRAARAELGAAFTGFAADTGQWINNPWCISRSERLLRPQDIWGYAAFFEKFGAGWLGAAGGEKARVEICQRLLDQGAVREHHGTLDIVWSGGVEGWAKERLQGGA